MNTASITIDPNGAGTITLDGSPSPISAAGAQAAQAVAMRQIKRYAARTGAPVDVEVHDPHGTTHLSVTADGTITRHEPPQLAPVMAETPAGKQEGTESATGSRSITHEALAAAQPDVHSPIPGRPSMGKSFAMKNILAREVDPEQLSKASAEWTTDHPAKKRTADTAGPFTGPPIDEAANVHPLPEVLELSEGRDVDVTTALSTTPDPLENDSRWEEIAQQPATQGWRGTLTGLGVKVSPSAEELHQRRETLREQIEQEEQQRLEHDERARTAAAQHSRRAAREREAAAQDKAERSIIQTPLEDPKVVLLANDKGGMGKTTAEFCIGATAGRIRGGDVVAWDANETRGNLGFRAQKAPHTRSVVDLLEEASEDFTTVQGSKRSTLARYTRNQGDNLFTVLASDESRDRQDLVDADAFAKVHEILGRFYSLILIDTGNNHRVSHFTAALAATDQLVIPVSAGADGAHAAETMMDTFESLGYGELVKNAVVLLNDSATRSGDATGIAAKFQDKVRAIIPIPFDPALDSGDEINFDALQPTTRAAYQEATASITQGLAAPKL